MIDTGDTVNVENAASQAAATANGFDASRVKADVKIVNNVAGIEAVSNFCAGGEVKTASRGKNDA